MSDKGFVNPKEIFSVSNKFVEDVITMIKCIICKRGGTKTKCNILALYTKGENASRMDDAWPGLQGWRIDILRNIATFNIGYTHIICYRGPVNERNKGIVAIDKMFTEFVETNAVSNYTIRYKDSPRFSPYLRKDDVKLSLELRPNSKDDVLNTLPPNFFELSNVPLGEPHLVVPDDNVNDNDNDNSDDEPEGNDEIFEKGNVYGSIDNLSEEQKKSIVLLHNEEVSNCSIM